MGGVLLVLLAAGLFKAYLLDGTGFGPPPEGPEAAQLRSDDVALTEPKLDYDGKIAHFSLIAENRSAQLGIGSLTLLVTPQDCPQRAPRDFADCAILHSALVVFDTKLPPASSTRLEGSVPLEFGPVLGVLVWRAAAVAAETLTH